MNEKEIFHKVQALVAEALVNQKEKVTLNANFSVDLGADYLDLIVMFMSIEEAFDTKIPNEEAEQLATVQQVVNYIGQKVFV